MFSIYQAGKSPQLSHTALPAAPGTYAVGQLLTLSGGKLAAISAARTTSAPYLCDFAGTIPASPVAGLPPLEGGDTIPVIPVEKNIVYETSLSAAAVISNGDKLQIAAGGLQVNKTAAGSFEIVHAMGAAKIGDTVRGRFIEPIGV
ncbi:hypothetical protein FACS1894202_00840 [Clostridia bacterium]|nr:hypothetical protein FACS1894202_00840 [Clostridia bacterium]